jgi:phage terminase small subunit
MKNKAIPVLDAHPPAPEHLSPESQRLWVELVQEEVTTSSRQALLITALESLDRATEARKVIEREGMVTVTDRSGMTHLHPLLRTERESKQLFAKIMSQLGLALPRNPW